MVCSEPYKTECGTIYFCKEKMCFIFNNPSIDPCPEDDKDKHETIVCMDVMMKLVHCMPEAKHVANEFADMMDKGTPEEVENMQQLDCEIYYNVLALFDGNDMARRPIHHVLMVSVFNGKAYIWLKRYLRNDQGEGDWTASCIGGYWFGLNDDENAILEYATDCIYRVEEEKKNMKHQPE